MRPHISLAMTLSVALILVSMAAPAATFATSNPNMNTQVKKLIQTYGPLIMLHPLDKYRMDSPEAMLDGPSTLDWGLVYNENDPQTFQVQLLGSRETSSDSILDDEAIARQDPNASNPDFRIWLDSDSSLWGGNLPSAKSYVRVLSPSANVLDLQFWFFYAYNGPVKVQATIPITQKAQLSTNLRLRNVGRHQGDWEHVTLRFTRADQTTDWRFAKIFLAQHSGGQWLEPSQLTYAFATHHPIIYSALDSHASYATTGMHVGQLVLTQGPLQVYQIDFTLVGVPFATYWPGNFDIVSSEVEGVTTKSSPPWFSYDGLWGPYELHVDGVSIGQLNLTYPLVDKGPVGPAQHGPDPAP